MDFSYYFEILKRVTIFSTVLGLSILLYLVIHLELKGGDYRGYEDYIPGIIWICLLTYLFWPKKNQFNYQGRIFILNIFKKVLSNPWAPALFRDSFIFSNMESLRTPIQDFEYTLCFYMFHSDKDYC